jgi:hypothetical protein
MAHHDLLGTSGNGHIVGGNSSLCDGMGTNMVGKSGINDGFSCDIARLDFLNDIAANDIVDEILSKAVWVNKPVIAKHCKLMANSSW